MRLLRTLPLLVVPLAVPGLVASDWPQFLGPRRDGTTKDAGLATAWTQAGRLRELWRAPVGVGYSGLAVVAGRLYGMDSASGDEYVFARRAEDGRELWRFRTAASPGDVYGGLGPRGTPSVEGSRVFTVAADGQVFCLDAGRGTVVWRRALGDETGWRPPAEGTAASPLPIAPDRVFVSSGHDQGAVLLKVVREGPALRVAEVWRNREMRNHFNNSVAHAGVLYGFDNSLLKAVDLETGAPLWRERGYGKGSLVLLGSHLVVLSEDGALALLEPSRSGVRELARQPVLRGRSWTPPSISGGRIYLRGLEDMVALGP